MILAIFAVLSFVVFLCVIIKILWDMRGPNDAAGW